MQGKGYLAVISAILAISYVLNGSSPFIFVVMIGYLIYLWRRRESIKVFISLIVVFLCFFAYTSMYERFNHSVIDEETRVLSGMITTIPLIDGDRLSFRMKVQQGEVIQVNYRIQSEVEKQLLTELNTRANCRLEGILEKPAPPSNFFSFDYPSYLHKQKIHWLFSPEFSSFSTCNSKNLTVYDRFLQFRQNGISFVNEHFPESIAGLVNALVFGDRSYVDEELLFAYQRLGVIHLLAVSGLHVGLVVGGLFFILLRLGLTREMVYLILMVCLPLYALLTGAAPPIVRASAMTFIVLLSLRLKRRIHPLDGISAIALLMLVYKPYFIVELGFQLSFLISYVLLLSASHIVSRYNHYFMQLLVVTILSQLAALPLLLFHFYEFSLLSFPLNLLFIPVISFIVLPLSIISVMIYLLSDSIGTIFIMMLETILHPLHRLLMVAEESRFGLLILGKPTPTFVIALLLVMFACFYMWEKGGVKRIAIPFLIAVFLLGWQMMYPSFSKYAKVTVLDVGQGDSFLIELPFRRGVYLIDTGGQVQFAEKEEWQERRRSFDLGKEVVLKTLKGKGIRKIDKLILTHGDYDHIGAASSIVGDINIDEVLYGVGVVEKEFEQQMLTQIHQQKIPIQFVKEGLKWRVKEEQFYILSPTGSEQNTNDRSIVLYAIISGVRFLFTGDFEKEGEIRIIENYRNLPVDILKVGHHGSKTSTSATFLDHIRPKVAIISAGRNNRYGHPHQDVMEELEKRNIRIVRTDEDGAIELTFSKKEFVINKKLH